MTSSLNIKDKQNNQPSGWLFYFLLEQLYWCYGEANTFDNSEIKAQYQELRCKIPEVSEERFDEIFDIISTLFVLQEKTAFQIGAKIGMRLAAEFFG